MKTEENGEPVRNGRVEEAGRAEEEQEDCCHIPPDGGFRGWTVLIGSFLCNGILFGVINSYSVIQDKLYADLKANNVTEASSKAALVGSLTMGTTFFLSAVSGLLTDFIGLRTTCFIGGALAAGGMLLSSFYTDNVGALYFTYGIMYGAGGALAYTPSLAILGHYFKRYMGIVNGLVTSGSSIFTMAMPHAIGYFLTVGRLTGTLRLLAVVSSTIMLCALVFKPLIKRPRRIERRWCTSVWTNRRYAAWAGIIAVGLCGYFVPYVHMSTFVKQNFEADADAKLPIMVIGLSSGLGRLVFGYAADRPGVSRILLQQVSFVVIGASSIVLPFTAGHFGWLLAVTFVMGVFDGCFVALLGPIAFDICGHGGATQAIGFLLALSAVPLTLGPYVAGMLYDHLGNYEVAMRLAGVPPILGGLAMSVVRVVKADGPKSYLDVNCANAKLNEAVGDDEKIRL